MSAPIIFLDIDGVLCTPRAHFAYGEGAWMQALDPVGVSFLRRLCLASGAKIVVSSTWRMEGGSCVAKLRRAGLPREVFHRAWSTPIAAGASRGTEIDLWLKGNGNPDYVILDDDSDMLESQKPRHVKTSNRDGISWKDMYKLCDLVGVDICAVRDADKAPQPENE